MSCSERFDLRRVGNSPHMDPNRNEKRGSAFSSVWGSVSAVKEVLCKPAVAAMRAVARNGARVRRQAVATPVCGGLCRHKPFALLSSRRGSLPPAQHQFGCVRLHVHA